MTDSIDFTFVVTTYNQQNTIIQTLESIKYQISKYGKKYRIQLIISDDCSSDNNVRMIELWLEKNKNLFSLINKLYYDNNNGTCHNFSKALSLVKGKYFKEIAGDDLLPENNVFKFLIQLDTYDFIMAPTLIFDGDIVTTNKKKYRTELRQAFYSYNDLKTLVKTAVPIKGGAVWNKKFNSKLLLDFVCNYRLVEDRPFWYIMFQENKLLRFKFDNSITLLYREGGGSTKHSTSYSRHKNDIKKMQNDLLASKDLNFVCRESILCERYNLKYINLSNIIVKIIDFRYRREINQLWEEIFLPEIDTNQKYINEIIRSSNDFISDNFT